MNLDIIQNVLFPYCLKWLVFYFAWRPWLVDSWVARVSVLPLGVSICMDECTGKYFFVGSKESVFTSPYVTRPSWGLPQAADIMDFRSLLAILALLILEALAGQYHRRRWHKTSTRSSRILNDIDFMFDRYPKSVLSLISRIQFTFSLRGCWSTVLC